MEEADTLCDRIGFINRGKVIAIDTPEQLKRKIKNNNNNNGNNGKYIGDIIKLYFKVPDNTNDIYSNSGILTKNLKVLKSFKFVKNIEQKKVDDGKSNSLIILQVEDINHNLPVLLKSIDNVESVEFSQPTLDDVFHTFTQGAINEMPEGGFMERYAQYEK
jgi:ABC-2 type transport system ATP-binding protein